MDHDKTAHLAAFSKAFNSDNLTSTEALMTANFVRTFYESPDSLYGCILGGTTAACSAVLERFEHLKVLIHFTESQQDQCGNRTFTTYQALGEFCTTGPFDVRAVDFYTFQDGKLASKDTYWKKITS